MNIEKDRLISLIEFTQQFAKMRHKPVASVAGHGIFALYEHEIQGFPGIRINCSDSDSEDEIWLVVERLHETTPPDIASQILRPWVVMSAHPTQQPHLRETIQGASLLGAGKPIPGQPPIDPDVVVSLADYEMSDAVKAQFSSYIDLTWRPWATEEAPRRETIRLYSKLYTLKQQLEGAIIEDQLELVWGVGLGIWRNNAANVSYPLIDRLVELSLNTDNSEIEIRPRDADARIEIDWYESVDNPGVAAFEKAARDFISHANTTFSPYDRETYEPLLRSAVSNLDANGVYVPDHATSPDRTPPKPEDRLQVTDTWVLFARPRTNSTFLQDLDKLKCQVDASSTFPPAVTEVVADPGTDNPTVELPRFRGVSAFYGAADGVSGENAQDLYFPKSYNDEQVRIVQLLETHNGVVVQGPPGTGKTHTIANVICHYLAHGKRVLVTSMKDPALAVLREQLPDEMRPLAISLLTSEHEGMKQFEHSITKIAAEVQALDRDAESRTIQHIEERIDALHGRLADIDHKTRDWTNKNTNKIRLEGEEIEPHEAANAVVENANQLNVIPDAVGIDSQYDPQFADSDIVGLRDARRILGPDIDYIDCSLPQLVEFPGANQLLEVHRDLSQLEVLKSRVASGEVPSLADSSQDTIARAHKLLIDIGALRFARSEIEREHYMWSTNLRERMQRRGNDSVLSLLDGLEVEFVRVSDTRTAFLEHPVSVPASSETDSAIENAVRNLADNKSPFGLQGIFGKASQKKQLESIRVLGVSPSSAADWALVATYFLYLKDLRTMAARWNVLARELVLEHVVDESPDGGVSAIQQYAHYRKLKQVTVAEQRICASASAIFPIWPDAGTSAHSPESLVKLEHVLRHHLATSGLTTVWTTKEQFQKALDGRSGRIIYDIRTFLAERLGNPGVLDATMQAEWSALTAELSRVLGLRSHLDVVADICAAIAASGAPLYADLLKRPLDGTVDALLPDNWRIVWRLNRLAAYLAKIDPQDNMKKLAKSRRDVETDLSNAYRDVVVRRTWLKLAQNASHSVRAALQAYLNAIQKIGKGTGKRAVRYRQDARMAASLANPAVPCWIMPHYRVSESLPPELGCFDLVIIDEASQSDLTALPSLLRAKKVLIVGDDKQVSPEGVGLEEERIRSIMSRFRGSQVATYRAQMSPERSIYDLFKVVFAKSSVLLKEHFRCVSPIIEYSKREFYNHELRPLRVPKSSERLDPPLVDVFVEGGYRKGMTNLAEARFVVDEIKAIAADPALVGRTIGVVSLLADKQALEIWERLADECGPEIMQRHRIACGDARTFQGKERDIMFLSMVAAPNEAHAVSRDTFAQRFNVAASRARDRMYLVRSVGLEHLSPADLLRRNLISHFFSPYAQDEARVGDLRKLCESPFERELYDELTGRGYRVSPQVRVGQYRIDMVVDGDNDARLAVECDGDQYHGPDKWSQDMQRQRVLERAGWVFWRCFATTFIRRRDAMISELLAVLSERGIEPIGAESAPRSVHTEHRVIPCRSTTSDTTETAPTDADNPGWARPPTHSRENRSTGIETQTTSASLQPTTAQELQPKPITITGTRPANTYCGKLNMEVYRAYRGPAPADPRSRNTRDLAEGLLQIVTVEGPMQAKRAYEMYIRACGLHHLGPELKHTLNSALSHTIRLGLITSEDEVGTAGLLYTIIRTKNCPPIIPRTRGPRSLDEIPPSEIQVVARCLVEYDGFVAGSSEHFAAVLDQFDAEVTAQSIARLKLVTDLDLAHVDDYMRSLGEQPG